MPAIIPTPSKLLASDIQASPCASYWLKEAIAKMSKRDCLDALGDAETLLIYCRTVCLENGLKV